MALDTQSLVRNGSVPYGAGEVKSLFLYATPDSVATVSASGYFNGATNTLRKGDRIEVFAALGGTPDGVALMVTSATGAATVTTAATKATALA